MPSSPSPYRNVVCPQCWLLAVVMVLRTLQQNDVSPPLKDTAELSPSIRTPEAYKISTPQVPPEVNPKTHYPKCSLNLQSGSVYVDRHRSRLEAEPCSYHVPGTSLLTMSGFLKIFRVAMQGLVGTGSPRAYVTFVENLARNWYRYWVGRLVNLRHSHSSARGPVHSSAGESR